MQYFKRIVLRLLCLNCIFLFLMSLYRCVFFLYYGKGTDCTGLGQDIIRAFIMGLRLDASVLSLLNIPVVLTVITILFLKQGGRFNKILSAVKVYYTVIVGALLVFLCCDFGFYSYFQDHFNSMIYGLFEDDTKAILLTIKHNYNIALLLLGFAALFAGAWFLTKFVLKNDWSKAEFTKNTGLKILISALFIFVCGSVIRGSYGDHPLIVNSSVSSNVFLNKVATNGFFTLQNAIASKQREDSQVDYMAFLGYKDDARKAFADFLNKKEDEIPSAHPERALTVKYPYNEKIEAVKPNVIIIVMESFGADLLQYNSADFDVLGSLKQHLDEDIVFYNFVPAWNASQRSVEGIITNVGTPPDGLSRFQSKYQYVQYPQNGQRPYKAKGYDTVFLYGGNLGWRNLGGYMSNSGFDKVIGGPSMDSAFSSNEWGVYDEFLFEYLYGLLEKENKQFIFALTTTNHPPYSLPEDYERVKFTYPKELADRLIGKSLAEQRFQTYRYSCEELGKFLSKVKNSPYAKNTIIAVTGDHNFKNIYSYSNEEFFNSVRVPLYLYIPESLKPENVDDSVFGSYLDILPTLYSLSLSDAGMMVMGKDLFSEAAKSNIIYSPGDGFLGDSNYAMHYRLKDVKKSRFFTWDKNNPQSLILSERTDDYNYLIKYANALVAVSDYILKTDYK